MADNNKSYFDRFFPDTELTLYSGPIEESGTGHTLDNGKHTRERWVKVNGKVLFGADEQLYQSSYGHDVEVAADGTGRVIAYKNKSTGAGSEPTNTSAVGAIAMVFMLTAVAYFGGIWNFIWKGFDIWWLTVLIITAFSIYAVLWTPIYVAKEIGRQRRGHAMVNGK